MMENQTPTPQLDDIELQMMNLQGVLVAMQQLTKFVGEELTNIQGQLDRLR